MGKKNGDLVRACFNAQRAGDTDAWQKLARAVDATQESCQHPDLAVRSDILKQGTGTSGKYKAGGRMMWCTDCSKVLGYEE